MGVRLPQGAPFHAPPEATIDHDRWMIEALDEAHRAAALGEVPVGALAVYGGTVVGRGGNRTRTLQDPTAHAEMIALRQAAERLGSWRLLGVTLVVTLEPCAMCAGACVLARIERLVFGAADPKAGMCGSLENLTAHPGLNHRVEVVAGVRAAESGALLSEFFRARRDRPPPPADPELNSGRGNATLGPAEPEEGWPSG